MPFFEDLVSAITNPPTRRGFTLGNQFSEGLNPLRAKREWGGKKGREAEMAREQAYQAARKTSERLGLGNRFTNLGSNGDSGTLIG